MNSHRDEELFDLFHGVGHPIIGIWDGSHHLNEHMQLHGQVSVFGFTALPELFFLTRNEKQISRSALGHNMTAMFLGGVASGHPQTLFLSLMEPLPRTEILAPVSSCSLLIVLPWGPKSFPTKLTCGSKNK